MRCVLELWWWWWRYFNFKSCASCSMHVTINYGILVCCTIECFFTAAKTSYLDVVAAAAVKLGRNCAVKVVETLRGR